MSDHPTTPAPAQKPLNSAEALIVKTAAGPIEQLVKLMIPAHELREAARRLAIKKAAGLQKQAIKYLNQIAKSETITTADLLEEMAASKGAILSKPKRKARPKKAAKGASDQ